MFSYTIVGVPALKMVHLSDIDINKFYLSKDQSVIVFLDSDGSRILYDLVRQRIEVYDEGCTYELTENHPSCSMLYPSEVVKVSMRFEIMGGDNAN